MILAVEPWHTIAEISAGMQKSAAGILMERRLYNLAPLAFAASAAKKSWSKPPQSRYLPHAHRFLE